MCVGKWNNQNVLCICVRLSNFLQKTKQFQIHFINYIWHFLFRLHGYFYFPIILFCDLLPHIQNYFKFYKIIYFIIIHSVSLPQCFSCLYTFFNFLEISDIYVINFGHFHFSLPSLIPFHFCWTLSSLQLLSL